MVQSTQSIINIHSGSGADDNLLYIQASQCLGPEVGATMHKSSEHLSGVETFPWMGEGGPGGGWAH